MQLDKLRGIIAQKGMKKKDLATEFGISVQALNKKLKGETKITAEDAVMFCNVLGITNAEQKCEIFLTTSSQY